MEIGDGILRMRADTSQLQKSVKDATVEVEKGMEKMSSSVNDVSKSAEDMGKKLEAGLQKASTALRTVGIAFTAAGAAGLKMSADARKLNAELGQTAITVGASTKEMRELALATTDVTFPLQSVAATFDLLARAGVTNTEEMQKSAKAFDALADATGSTAERIADMLIPMYRALGEEIPKTTAELDKFTWLAKTTLVDLEDLGGVMRYVAAYGQDLELTTNDLVAVMAVLSERGIQGSAATMMFRRSITEATSSGQSLFEVLNVTDEELAKFNDQMQEATGMTEQYAEAANVQYGILDRMKQTISELTLRFGSLLQPLEPLLGLMTSLGPALIFLSTATGRHVAAMIAQRMHMVRLAPALAFKTMMVKAATTAQWLWNAALIANPIGAVVMAIAALIAGLAALMRHLGITTDILRGPSYRAMDDLNRKARELGQTMMDTLRASADEARKLVRELEGQRTALEDFINFLETQRYLEMEFLPEEVLLEIEEIDPGVAASIRTVQDQMRELRDETDQLGEELAEERILEIQMLLADPETTKADRHRLMQELIRLTARDWHRILDNNRETLLQVARTTLGELNQQIADAQAWITMYDKAVGAFDDTYEYVAKHIIPLLNEAFERGFLDDETLREMRSKWYEIIDEAVAAGVKFGPVQIETEHGVIVTGTPEEPKLTYDPEALAKIFQEEEGLESMQYGGVVPGPIGAPIPIIAHGGERFLGVQHTGMPDMKEMRDWEELADKAKELTRSQERVQEAASQEWRRITDPLLTYVGDFGIASKDLSTASREAEVGLGKSAEDISNAAHEWADIGRELADLLDRTSPETPVEEGVVVETGPRGGGGGGLLEMPHLLSMQFGGIVPGPLGAPVPIIAHGGEEFLGVQNIGRSHDSNVIVNVGVLPGDDVTIRKLVRQIKEYMGQDNRRNAFHQVNLGHYYGKTSL